MSGTDRTRETQNELAHIDALMSRLAQDSPQQAPPRVRQHMTQAVQQYRSRARRNMNRWLLAAAVLFAALLLTSGTIVYQRSGHRTDPAPRIMANSNSQPTPAVIEPKPFMSKTLQRPKIRRRQNTNGANPQPVFVTLPFSDPALMTGTSVTIRLALSEAELLAMGVRPIESNSSGSYVADLVLGDDGLPRAIRIVSNGQRIPGGS